MKIKDLLLESFKGALNKFSNTAPTDEVETYLDKFRQLAKKNIIQGPDKDIGKWIKGDWDTFKGMIDNKSNEKSNREVKKANKKDRIVVHEDTEKLIIIPLSRSVSCSYGKNTKWCTASTQDSNHFNKYFHHEKDVMVYYIDKVSNNKIAAQINIEPPHRIRYWDTTDERIYDPELMEHIGFDKDTLLGWIDEHRSKIKPLMDVNNLSNTAQTELVTITPSAIKSIINPSEETQIAAISQLSTRMIKLIKNPTPTVQKIAVERLPASIIYINDPSIKAQTIAVELEGQLIRHISNPSEDIQLKAVINDSNAIRYIPGPSETIQREAVQKEPSSIRFIKNPTEKVQQLAVKQDAFSISYIDSPSDKLQLSVVTLDPTNIQFIKNPSKKVIKQYKKITGTEYDLEAIKQSEMDGLEDMLSSINNKSH